MEEMIQIERLSYGSGGIGHTSQGKTVFVPATAPGDLVRTNIHTDKGNFCLGNVVEILNASPFRQMPPCSFHETCGGCPWIHLTYQAQLDAKRENVLSALVRGARYEADLAEKLVGPCRASKRELGYRNKLEFSTRYNSNTPFTLGFSQENSTDITSVSACLLADKAIEKSPKALEGALRYISGKENLGIFRVGVRSSVRTKDVEVALWTKPGGFPRGAAAQVLKNALRTTSIVRVIADPGKARKIKGVEVLDGKGYWEEKLGDFHFMTSAPSFFQVNTVQAEVLVDVVAEGLKLESTMKIADLYAGGGTFAITLADKVSHVFAVEAASSSVKDLRRNVLRNNVDVEVIGGDSARSLMDLGTLDAVVVDPPRAGLSVEAIDGIAAASPSQIAYVSCDPSTWARDVSRLKEFGYTLTKVQPVDLFPQSYHVEVASFFSR